MSSEVAMSKAGGGGASSAPFGAFTSLKRRGACSARALSAAKTPLPDNTIIMATFFLSLSLTSPCVAGRFYRSKHEGREGCRRVEPIAATV